MTNKTGGAAFPYDGERCCETGMSLLDYFAGSALAGLVRNAGDIDAINERAKKAYRYATAMLAERERISEAQGD